MNNQDKGGMTEVNYPSQQSGRMLGWVFFIIIALIVIAAFIMWSPGGSSSVWTGILNQPATTTTQGGDTTVDTSTAVPASYSPRPGTRVYESGKYVTYVYFTGTAFSPASITVNAGEVVRFVNVASTAQMRVGSRPENVSSTQYSTLTEAKASDKNGKFDIALSAPGIWSYENLATVQPRVLGVVYVK